MPSAPAGVSRSFRRTGDGVHDPRGTVARVGCPDRREGRLLRGCLLLALAASPGAARADGPAAETRVVDLVVAGSVEDAARLAAAAGELLRRLDVELRVVRVERLEPADVVTPNPDAEPVVARAWVDLTPVGRGGGESSAALYLVDGAWERVRVRRVPLGDGVDEVVREELAHVLAFGVDGLLAGRPLERTREELRVELGLPVPEPVPPAPPDEVPLVVPAPEPSSAARSVSFRLGVGYELGGFADAAPVSHGPFAVLSFGLLQAPLRPALWLTAQGRAPLEAEGAPIGVRLDQGLFRLLLSVELPLTDDLGLLAAFGGGLDVARATPTLASGSSGVLAEPSTVVLGILRAVVGLRWRLFGATDLLVFLGCDVELGERSYAARRDGLEQRVLAPWPARPLLELALVADLLEP